MSLSTMNYELIEKVEGAIYIFNDEWSVAVDAIRATGKHLLELPAGFETAAEMRQAIARECGLEAEGWLREPDVPRDLCPDCAQRKEN